MRIQAIEHEFDEPIRDVITGMRQQGCSWQTIASAIGIPLSTLFKVQKKLNVPRMTITPMPRKNPPAADEKVKELGYRDMANAIRHMRGELHMTVTQCAECMGVDINIVKRHTPLDMKGVRNLSPEGHRAAVANLQIARIAAIQKRKTHGHPWNT